MRDNKRRRRRYSERKKSKKNRDVMSYEDMPLDDYEQEKTEISPAAVKKIIIGVCIAVFAGLIVFAFANRDKLTLENISTWWTYEVLGNAGDGYPVSIVGSDVSQKNFYTDQNRVAYASDTSFVTLNSTGSEVANIQLKYSTPVLKSKSTRYLAYGLGSQNYQTFSFDKQLYSGEVDEAIYTGDIASNGVYCIVTEGDGYLSTLYVFDDNNNRIYKYSFSEYYIMSVSLNGDGSKCVACGLSSDNGVALTGVYILDFKSEEPEAVYTVSGESAVECCFLNNKHAVIVGQSACYIVNSDSEDYITCSYDDRTLANYCFNPDTNSFAVALSRSGDGRSCLLVRYDENGEEKCSIETDLSADSLAMYKGVIGVLDGNGVYVYDSSGDLLNYADVGTGSRQISFTSESTVYVLSVNQIRFIDLNDVSTDDSTG